MLKKLIKCCLIICISSALYAVDDELEIPLQTLEQQLTLESTPGAEGNTSDQRDVQQSCVSQSAPFVSAFGSVSCKVLSATLLLSNTFGRLALAGCLGYKAYESALKAMQTDVNRTKHVLKAVCCFGAACMLLQDGYQWVLRQGA